MPYPLSADPETYQVAITLVVVAVLLALGNRRLLVVPLMLQYVLVSALLSADISQPIFVIRVTLGAAISTILYITGNHMERTLAGKGVAAGEGPPARPLPPSMGGFFRLLALAWAMLMAFGLWNAYPLTNLPALLTLTAFVLLTLGVTLALVSPDPLHIGVGCLMLLTGFEAVYLSLEASLLVVALLGLLDILIALAISYNCEQWLDAIAEEALP
jgi:hypothetical protein